MLQKMGLELLTMQKMGFLAAPNAEDVVSLCPAAAEDVDGADLVSELPLVAPTLPNASWNAVDGPEAAQDTLPSILPI